MIANFPKHYRIYPEGYLVTDGSDKYDRNADPMNMNGVSYNEDFPVFFVHVADDSVPTLEDHFDIVKPMTFEDHMDKVIEDVDPQEARNCQFDGFSIAIHHYFDGEFMNIPAEYREDKLGFWYKLKDHFFDRERGNAIRAMLREKHGK